MLTLPYRLFVTNAGYHNVASGSVIRLHCEASSISAPLIVWFKDSKEVYNDPPHVRIRNSLDGNLTTSVLIIDSFGTLDNGTYHCQASDGISSAESLSTHLSGMLVMYCNEKNFRFMLFTSFIAKQFISQLLMMEKCIYCVILWLLKQVQM